MPSKDYYQCKREAADLERRIQRAETLLSNAERKKQQLYGQQQDYNRRRFGDNPRTGPKDPRSPFGSIRLKKKIEALDEYIRSLQTKIRELRSILRAQLTDCQTLAQVTQKQDRGRQEAAVRKKMDQPAYWRDHDKALHAEVRADWDALYPR